MAAPRSSIDPSDFASVMNENTSVEAGLTAAVASNQAGGYPITAAVSRFSTVGTAGDSATLPAAIPGDRRTVFNKAAANSMDIFPAVGDQINALAVDAAYALAVTKGVTFYCSVEGVWDTILTA